MKKLIIMSVLILSVHSNTKAQFTSVGGGAAVSSGFPFHNMSYDANKSGTFAVSLKSIYKITVPFRISPSLTIFYPHISPGPLTKTTVSSFTFDINGHFVFNSLEKFEFYGLAGLDMLFAFKKEVTGPIIFKESDNAMGLNLGIGTYRNVNEKLAIFGEVKYIFSRYDQFMVNAGILLNINPMKKN